MRPDRQDDLVPPLAIVAGAVVSVVVTFLAFYSGGEEQVAPEVRPSPEQIEWVGAGAEFRAPGGR